MEFVTLDDVKLHLHLDDITAEDAYLTRLATSAESLALSKIHRSADDLRDMGEAAVAQFQFLVLQICEDGYDSNRGMSSTAQLHVTPLADSIICSLRKLSV